MKKFMDFASSARSRPKKQQCAGFVLVLGMALFVAGCGKTKDSSTSAAPAPQSTQNSSTAPAAAPQTATTTQSTNNPGPDLQKLNHALLQYVVRTHHKPASFDEFASQSGIHIPPPPAGKKYALDSRGFIILVNQ